MGTSRRRAASAVVVAALLVAGACSSDSSPSGSATPSGSFSSPPPPYTPVYAKGPCDDEVPQDPRIECGTLTVPEDRSKGSGGRSVVLPVAIVHTADPNPAPDPVVYFEGGPGAPGRVSAQDFLQKGYAGNRDVILFDQRGTGRAQPSLICPEVIEANAKNNGDVVTYDVSHQRVVDAVVACRDRLRAGGVDLDQYNTRVSADDVADLRTALGIREWNLFGVSYGTTLALQVMRAHPEGVRSVVIDSVFSVDEPYGDAEQIRLLHEIEGKFFQACAADPGCHAKYPNLESDFQAAIAALDAKPFRTTFNDPIAKRSDPFVVDGATALSGFFHAMYDSNLIPVLPSVIEQIKAGTADATLEALVQQLGPSTNAQAEAQKDAVNCSDRAFGYDPSVTAGLLAKDADERDFLGVDDVCAKFGVAPAPKSFNDPVRSGLPTLVLADELDPVTPSESTRHTADTLSHSTFVQFPGLGHGAVFSDRPCPGAIFRSFLAAPTSPVDTSCVASMGPPAWQL